MKVSGFNLRYAAVFGFIALAVLLAGTMSGCKAPEPAKPTKTTDPNAPPPPTPEEIARKAVTELGLDQPLPPPGSTMPATVRANVVNMFQRQHDELSRTPEGKAALGIVTRQVEDKIHAYEQGAFWEYVVAYTDAYSILQPGSKRFADTRDKANIQLRRPRVTVRGLTEVDGHQAALLSIYVPMDSQTFNERVGLGEEAHGIRFVSIFGKGRGILIEYLETGERFIAYLPSAE